MIAVAHKKGVGGEVVACAAIGKRAAHAKIGAARPPQGIIGVDGGRIKSRDGDRDGNGDKAIHKQHQKQIRLDLFHAPDLIALHNIVGQRNVGAPEDVNAIAGVVDDGVVANLHRLLLGNGDDELDAQGWHRHWRHHKGREEEPEAKDTGNQTHINAMPADVVNDGVIINLNAGVAVPQMNAGPVATVGGVAPDDVVFDEQAALLAINTAPAPRRTEKSQNKCRRLAGAVVLDGVITQIGVALVFGVNAAADCGGIGGDKVELYLRRAFVKINAAAVAGDVVIADGAIIDVGVALLQIQAPAVAGAVALKDGSFDDRAAVNQIGSPAPLRGRIIFDDALIEFGDAQYIDVNAASLVGSAAAGYANLS